MRWLQKKHPKAPMKELFARYSRQRKPGWRSKQWTEGNVVPFEAASVRVQQFKLGWSKGPGFAQPSMESPVHIEKVHAGFGKGHPETS